MFDDYLVAQLNECLSAIMQVSILRETPQTFLQNDSISTARDRREILRLKIKPTAYSLVGFSDELSAIKNCNRSRRGARYIIVNNLLADSKPVFITIDDSGYFYYFDALIFSVNKSKPYADFCLVRIIIVIVVCVLASSSCRHV